MRQPAKKSLARRLAVRAKACQLQRKLPERRRQIVVIVERDRPALVERLKRHPVITRERMSDRHADHALDVRVADIGPAVGTAQNDGHLVAAIALPERGCEPAGALDRRELLIRDDDYSACTIERIQQPRRRYAARRAPQTGTPQRRRR